MGICSHIAFVINLPALKERMQRHSIPVGPNFIFLLQALSRASASPIRQRLRHSWPGHAASPISQRDRHSQRQKHPRCKYQSVSVPIRNSRGLLAAPQDGIPFFVDNTQQCYFSCAPSRNSAQVPERSKTVSCCYWGRISFSSAIHRLVLWACTVAVFGHRHLKRCRCIGCRRSPSMFSSKCLGFDSSRPSRQQLWCPSEKSNQLHTSGLTEHDKLEEHEVVHFMLSRCG